MRTKAIEKTSTGEQLKSLDLLFLTCGLKMTVGGPRINEALLLLPGGLVLGYNHAGKTTFLDVFSILLFNDSSILNDLKRTEVSLTSFQGG